jgi:hypothetical protein
MKSRGFPSPIEDYSPQVRIAQPNFRVGRQTTAAEDRPCKPASDLEIEKYRFVGNH